MQLIRNIIKYNEEFVSYVLLIFLVNMLFETLLSLEANQTK